MVSHKGFNENVFSQNDMGRSNVCLSSIHLTSTVYPCVHMLGRCQGSVLASQTKFLTPLRIQVPSSKLQDLLAM